jgi:transposase InsO family protein
MYCSFIDLCTRFPIAVPLKSATEKSLSLALYKQAVLQWGTPEIIHSDSGVQYKSPLFQNFCKDYNIIHKTTKVYLTQANPCELQTEYLNHQY